MAEKTRERFIKAISLKIRRLGNCKIIIIVIINSSTRYSQPKKITEGNW